MTSSVRDTYARLSRNFFRTPQISAQLGRSETHRSRVVKRGSHSTARRDWLTIVSPSLDDLTPAQREHLAATWRRDGKRERASIASATRSSLHLLLLGAPPDLVRSSQRASLDAIAHAELCFGLASAYAGRRIEPDALHSDEALADGVDSETTLLTTIHHGCIGKTTSAMVALSAAKRCVDPVIIKVLRRTAADDTRHAGLAWRVVQWLLDQEPLLAKLVSDACITDDAADPAPSLQPPRDGWLHRYGRLNGDERAAIGHRTLHEVVDPCARALLEPIASAASAVALSAC